MQTLLLECAVRAALIATATAAVLLALRVKNAAARHAAWLGVVVWMLALPAWTLWAPKASLRVLPAPVPISIPVVRAVPVASPVLPQAIAVQVSSAPARRPAWNWILLGYLAGVAVLLSRLAIGAARAHALMCAAENREGHWDSSLCAAPVTVGCLHPVVILPREWRAWPASKLDAVLAHEQEHARRRDPLIQFLALVNRAIFWFHPLAWWLERRLSALAEEACDTAVLSRGHDPYDYSTYLLDMARAVQGRGMRVDALGMAMPGSSLPWRIRTILSARPTAPITRSRMAGAIAASLLVSAVFAAGTLDHRRMPAPAVAKFLAVAPIFDAPAAPAPSPSSPEASPAPQRSTTPPASTATGRLTVLFFDVTTLTPGEEANAQSSARNLVNTRVQSGDRVSVMSFGGGTIKIHQDFTDDVQRLVQAIGQLPPAEGGSPDGDKRLDGLRAAVRILTPVEGKKSFIYFTAGGQATATPGLQSLIDEAVQGSIAFYAIDVRTPGGKAELQGTPVPAFDVASVKHADSAGGEGRGGRSGSGGPGRPGPPVSIPDASRVSGYHATLAELIQFAYGIHSHQLVGPEWLHRERFDIEAKSAGPATAEQLRQMLQRLLAERFQMTLHRETRILPVYEMTVAKGGPKMPEAKPGEKAGDSQEIPGGCPCLKLMATTEMFAEVVETVAQLEMPIVDKTGLSAKYRFGMHFEPGQDIIAPLEENFGLKLQAKKDPVEVLVIDHAEKSPTEN
jgi:uncharacterized protein (TIGR03435 family)